MPDIRIGRASRLGVVHITSETPKGRMWMLTNTTYVQAGTSIYVAIQREHKEDFITNLKEAELTYDEE